jgi:hypothetical protein
MDPRWFLGLDLVTQSLTAALIDVTEGDIQQFAVNFNQP